MSSNTPPLVSIITPSYNQAAFLEHTLRSVLAQDWPVEYLVVDGASTDGSQQIIERYAGRLAWWVSEPDHGQAEAINKGFARASGEIVAWLNSDDLFLPGAIRSAVTALQADPSLGMVYGDAVTIDPAGRPLNLLTFGQWGLLELACFRMICQPAVFMRRTVLEQAGPLDPSYHYMLDHHLWLRMARVAPVRHIPGLWAAARHHPAAKNVAHAPGFEREIFRILDWMRTLPDLGPLFEQDAKRVEGGAYRLAARYLLDGGLAGPALKCYGRAMANDPAFAIQHWHRILFAVLSLVGGRPLAALYYQMRRSRRPGLDNIPGVEDWPGLTGESNAP